MGLLGSHVLTDTGNQEKPWLSGAICTSTCIAYAMSIALATATTLATAETRAEALIIATCLTCRFYVIDQFCRIYDPATNSAA